MTRILFAILLCSLGVTTAQSQSPMAGAGHGMGLIKVMILDGQSGGAYHNWKLTTPVLKAELEETGLFSVTVVSAPSWGQDFSGFELPLSHYQAVVMNYDGPDWPANLKTSFEQYVRGGGGVVIVHAADNAFPNWLEFNLMTGIGGWRDRTQQSGLYWYIQDGKLVSDPSPGPAGMHGARLPFQVAAQQPEHPILKGLPPVWMHFPDELYGRLRGPGQNMTVLATAHSDPKNKGTDHDEPILMVLSYGKGRIFHTVLGHDVAALSCVGFIATFQRGTEWAATGKVTQKIPAAFPTINTVSYRADIAEMDPAMLKDASDVVRIQPKPVAPPPMLSPHGMSPHGASPHGAPPPDRLHVQ